MSSRPVFLTSDVHLGAVPPETERSFHRWIETAATEASEILINGDLFDFWFEYRNSIPGGHTRTLDLLTRVVADGIPITLMGGNHDWWGGRHLTEQVGLIFHQDPIVRDVAGKRTLIAHGDGLGRGDMGYKILRWLLRSPLTVASFRQLPHGLGEWLGARVSRTNERRGSGHGPNPERVRELRTWALEKLDEDPSLELIALGHTHQPEVTEARTGRWILNSGDWVYRQTYVILSEGEPPELLDWNG